MIDTLVLEALSPTNVDEAYGFLERMIGQNRGLYQRPKSAMTRAAAKPNRGVLAYVDGNPSAVTVLYDTPFPELLESGSTCVDNTLQGLRLGPIVLATAIINLYAHPENHGITIIGDVLQSSVASKKMVDALGFQTITPPEWYDAAHRGRATPEQLKESYHCVTIDQTSVPHLLNLLGSPSFLQRRAA